MPRAVRTKFNFNQGELSPLLYSRSDVNKYANGLKVAENVRVLPHGPVVRRNGTQFISEVKDSTKATRLIPFRVGSTNHFTLEFGENYIRFFTDKARIEIGGTPLELSTPWTSNELDGLQFKQIGNTLHITHEDHQVHVLIRDSSTSWRLEVFYPYPPPTDELGYSPATSVTPGATTGFSVTFTAADSVFLDGDVGRQIVNLTKGETGRAAIISVTSGTQVVCDIIEDFTSTGLIDVDDWLLDLSPVCDLTPSGIAGGSVINITADITQTVTAVNAFRADDIGKYILMHGGLVQIIQINTGSDIDCEVIKSLSSLDETGNWTLEEETWTNSRGYPRAVGLFEQRLIFGGTKAEPSSLWFSEVGIYDGFGIGPNDADAIDVDIVEGDINDIQWIASGRDLIVGTLSGEITITGPGGLLTPAGITSRLRTDKGSNVQNTTTSGSEVIFVQKAGKKIRTFVYNFDIDGYKAEDLLFLAEHMTNVLGTSIIEITHTSEPNNVIYAVLSTGVLIAGVFDRDQQVLGWTRYVTDGAYERVMVIPGSEFDEVWVIVNRTIDGNTKRYIEIFDNGVGTGLIDGFSDSFLTYSGASTGTLSGLDHLEGKTVQIKGDGAIQTSKVVTGGSITLDSDVTSATVGLPYTSTVETLDEDFNVGRGSMLGQRVRWVEPIVRVINSTKPLLNGQFIPSRIPDMEMDNPVDLFTGDLKYSSSGIQRLTITTSDPLPLIITGITGIAEGSV